MLGAVQSRAGALRERPFRVLFLAQSVSLFGDYLVPLALTFAVLDLTRSPRALGLVLTARVLPMVMFYLAGGVWADRLPRRSLMIGSHLVRGATQALLGALLVTGQASIWQLVVLQAAHGVATAVFRPASSGLLPEVVTPGNLQQANGLLWLAVSVGSIVGPPIASGLVVTVGGGWAILADATTFFAAAALLLRLPVADVAPAAETSFLRDLADGWSAVRARVWVWTSLLYFAIFQLVFLGAFSVIGPIVAKRSLGGAGAWALITAATGAGSLVGGVAALRLTPRRPLVVCFSLGFGAVPSLVLLAVAAPAPAVAAVELLTGFAIAYGGTLWSTTLQARVPADARSRVASYDWMGSTALRPIGLAIAGPVAAALGTRDALLGAAVVVAAATVAILGVPSVRDLERPETVPRAEVAEPDYAREM